MRAPFYFLLLILLPLRINAQAVSDSLVWSDPRNWTELVSMEGIKTLRFSGKLFGEPQNIWVTTIDPTLYELKIEQFDALTRISQAAQQDPTAVLAVNGGYFVTRNKEAIPVGYLKIDGTEVPAQDADESDAAMGIDPDGTLSFTVWAEDRNMPRGTWKEDHPDILTAGPILVGESRPQIPWTEYQKEKMDNQTVKWLFAPRTAIGIGADSAIVIVTVDGRRKESYGVSLAEIARIGGWMRLSWMMNLDGGGSTTLWVRGKGVLNKPSDGKSIIHVERPVANMVKVVRRH